MRAALRWIAIASILLAGIAAPPPLAQADNQDTTADRVLGQATFSTSDVNHGSLSASSLYNPLGETLDPQGNLFVADALNNRVLEYLAPLTTHQAASRVFGQPNFTTHGANQGGLGAGSLFEPVAVALDSQGNLFVADTGNNRVLEFDAPLSTAQAASRVFGQPNFITNGANQGGLSARSLFGPAGVALDGQGDLYVGDYSNNRVLEYLAPLATHQAASRVFGQAGSFTTKLANNGGLSAASLDGPGLMAVDPQGNLYLADSSNNRVLEYDDPSLHDTGGDRVFGQPSFITNTINTGGRGPATLDHPVGLALDAPGNLYVADAQNNRVLEYDHPLTNQTADRVFGQAGSFTTGGTNHGGLSADSLSVPAGVAIDPLGNLYVVDYSNNRVLEYDLPVPHGPPALDALSPTRVAAGSPDFTLTVNGSGFYASSLVRWNGSNRPTTFVSSTQLSAAISAADVASGGPFAVTVFTPAPGGGITSLINLTLYSRVPHDTTADTEQGQPNFAANAVNNARLLGGNRLNGPGGVAVDLHSGRLFVADNFNNRVLSWPSAAALTNGQAADLVLGQPNFIATTANTGGRSAKSLYAPIGVALDASGDLYVADSNNNRVLEYHAPLSSDMAASLVFGQGGSFISGLANNGGVSANSLDYPTGLALDAAGNLFVADAFNNRVLEYDTPLSSGATADHVFGQPTMGSDGFNQGGLNASSLGSPYTVGLDAGGNLYVADTGNNRVLEYNAPLSTDGIADRVFGQAGSFSTATLNKGGLSAASLGSPYGLALDGWGNLYVAEVANNRVLEYEAPLANGTADRVFGQTSFTSGVANDPSLSASSLSGPTSAALDAQGNLYVADKGNNRLLEYDWAPVKLALPLMMR